MKERRIVRMVLTGGPCAGKTSAIDRLKSALEAKGWAVLVIGETATELISGGVAPWTLESNLAYQSCQLALQIEKERIFSLAAAQMKGAEGILILCDRGCMDNRAYMTEEEFAAALLTLGETEETLLARYDGIFHLVTAAKGAECFYTLANNAARTETAEAAALLDDRLLLAWQGHPCHRVIDNSTDFEGKLCRLVLAVEEALAALGE